MNGIHDMGGMDGFGRVRPEDSEAFHEDWEKQIFVAFNLVRTNSLNEDSRKAASMTMGIAPKGQFPSSCLSSLNE